MDGEDPASPAGKLAELTELLQGPSLFALLQIKGHPAREALAPRVMELRAVVYELCAQLTEADPVRLSALESLKSVERLLENPLEWHILTRAHELRQDPADPEVRAAVERSFYEEHVARAVWMSAPPDGTHLELRKSLRLPVLAEVDVILGGNPTRLRTENLSRDGVCLEVPPTFDEKNVTLQVHLTATGRQIQVGGRVAWRRGTRAGVAFEIAPPEQSELDAAIQTHFNALRAVVDRWLELSPNHPDAVACSCLVGYYSNILPSNRQPFLQRLVAAAEEESRNVELHIALAKLMIEERDFAAARAALRRVEKAASNDPRFQQITATLARRTGSSRGLFRGFGRGVSDTARAAAVVLLIGGFFGALTYALASARSPFDEIAVPRDGLPCARAQRLSSSALCYLDSASYARLPLVQKRALARESFNAWSPQGVTSITVVGEGQAGILDDFDRDLLDLIEQAGRAQQ
jgi:hypothetical protein